MLRATAILFSLLLHGLVGNALWLRLQPEQFEALNLGEAQEIFLEPQGMDLSEVTNIGDDLQSLEAQPSVAIDQAAPPPPMVAPLDEPQNTAEDASGSVAENVTPLAPQEAPADTLSRAQPETIRDVIASEESTIEPNLVDVRGPEPERIEEQEFVAANQASSPEQNQLSDAVKADETLPQSLSEAPPLAAQHHPPPDTIAEANQPASPDALKEPALESYRGQSPSLTPLEEAAPEDIQLVAQPEQVVIVTEYSSGEEKKGGDASITRLYLGKINERVQRAKVNPRSRMTGTVVVKFTVGLDGSLIAKEVVSSSGAEVLDRAALTTLERAAPFPEIPPEVSALPMTFSQTFRFLVR